MAQFFGSPSEINRFLGQVDQDDPTNLPIGLAALCRNSEFSLTSCITRSGINSLIQGVNKSPITGILGAIYTPESAATGDVYFQLPIFFDMLGALQAEFNIGTGTGVVIPSPLLTLPKNAHMVGVQAYNNAYLAFSNLLQPLSQMAVYNLKQNVCDPYGLKPFGWLWTADSNVVVGEVAAPSSIGGNGHTYQCTQAGVTGDVEPAWPTAEGAQINDGTAIWKELTPVLANRIPAPMATVITQQAGTGAFAAAKDIYVLLTFTNGVGETIAGLTSFTGPTVLNDSIIVPVPALNTLAGWIQGLGAPYAITGAKIYIAQVNHGAAAPAIANYHLAATVALNSNTVLNSLPGATATPPTSNTARVTPGQLPIPVTAPIVARQSGTGAFAAGRDVYVVQTYVNALGETTPGPTSSVINTVLNDAAQVTVVGLDGYVLTGVRIYEADVATGQPAPDVSEFALVGTYQPGATPVITAAASGSPPPTANSTGAGGNIQADSANGGANGTQGYRYAVVMFMNRNFTWSGFTKNAVVKYAVDENGYELAMFNIPTGPANVVARAVPFTIADGTDAGGYWWIGSVGLKGTTQVWEYPTPQNSAGINIVPTLIYDNVTTSATFNFTDAYLSGGFGNNVTDRLRAIWPKPCVDAYYSKALDRMFQCGVPGWYSTCWISLAGDVETYYGDTSFVSVGNDDGQRAWCVREFKNSVFLLRERSGYVLTPNPTNPALWAAEERWNSVGPCGPRAVDVCSEFMIFVHRSGIYRYEQGEPELVTKEMPKAWSTINWAYGQIICCKIDHEKHVVHVLVPVGGSTINNLEITISYLEGWNNPIHFSTYASKEISMDAARRYSLNDVQAYVCTRIERQIPAGSLAFINGPIYDPTLPIGPQGAPQLTPDYFVSQFVYGSSGADGTVQASTPGIFNDNGAGIDWQYETVCPQKLLTLNKLEGFNLNARGNGPLQVSFLAGREMVTDSQGGKGVELKVRPVDLVPNQSTGISRNTPAKINERWRMRFTNGKQPDVWAELKYACMFGIAMYSGRSASEVK